MTLEEQAVLMMMEFLMSVRCKISDQESDDDIASININY